MAGDRHHILPRFLLKGFASRINGKKVFSTLYRKGFEPREVSTRDVGVERNFYQAMDGTSVDRDITNLEGPFATLVERLRRMPSGHRVENNSNVPSFVAHLLVRTKHLRDSFNSMAGFMVQQLDEHLADPANQVDILLRHPRFLPDEIEKGLDQMQVPLAFRAILRKHIQDAVPAFLHQWASGGNPEMQAMTNGIFSHLRKMLPEVIRNGHIQALSGNLVPKPRTETYRSLYWFVMHSEIPMVLGDAGLVFEVQGPKRYKAYDEMADELLGVYLPLSSQRLLVGTPLDSSPTVDFHSVRVAMVRLCRDFFVADQVNADLMALRLRIGEDCDPLTHSEMDMILKDALMDDGEGNRRGG